LRFSESPAGLYELSSNWQDSIAIKRKLDFRMSLHTLHIVRGLSHQRERSSENLISEPIISQTDTGTSALWQVTLLPGESKTVTYTIAKVLTGAQVSAIASTVTATAAAPAAGKAIPISLMVDSTVTVGKEVILTAIDPTNTRLLKGVEITVTKPSGKTVSITTDASGKASFVVDEDGIYKYSVGASYSLQAGTQTVAAQPSAATPPRKPPATTGSTAPPATTPSAGSGGLFLFAIVAAGVVLVGIVALVVGFLAIKRKQS